MRKRFLILIGVLSVLIFAIAFLPAKLVLGPLAERMSAGEPSVDIQLDQIGGTVWNGFALIRMPKELNRLAVSISWDVKASRLFLGELALGLGFESRDFRLSGFGFLSFGSKGLSSLTGDVQAAILDRLLKPQGISIDGQLNINDVSFAIGDSRVTKAGGTISWSGGQVKLPASVGGDLVEFAGLKAELQEVNGDLLVPVTETDTNQPLGEFALLMEQGLYSITVLQRVMTLAGMENDGNDDKVLIKQQQPLSFDF